MTHIYPHASMSIYVAFGAFYWAGSQKCLRSRYSCFTSFYSPGPYHWQLSPRKLLLKSVLLKMCAGKIFSVLLLVLVVYMRKIKQRKMEQWVSRLWWETSEGMEKKYFYFVPYHLIWVPYILQTQHASCSHWHKAAWVSSVSTDAPWAKCTLAMQ